MPIMYGAVLQNELTQIKLEIRMLRMIGNPLDQSDNIHLNQNVIAWMQKPLHTEQIAQIIYQALNESNN